MSLNKRNIRRGQFWTIDNKLFRGHKGRISKVKTKQKKVEAVCITTSTKAHGRSTIPLNKNPDPKSNKKSYVMKRPMEATMDQMHTQHKDHVVTDKRDKSVFRKIGRCTAKKLK